jgi:hypothetical protein
VVAKDAERFRDLTFDAEDMERAEQYATMAEELVRFAPHVVLFSGGRPAVQHALVPLEQRWPKTERERPRYVSFALIGSHLLEFVAGDTSRRKRVFGVWPVSSTQANTRFVARYNELFPDDGVTRSNAPSATYDAFYLLAYATYSVAPGQPLDGRALSRAFARLQPPGRKVEVGMSGIFDAYAEIAAQRNVDLVGATGGMDFDMSTGDAPIDQAIFCVSADGKSGVESGLVYSAANARLSGNLACP